MTDASTMNNGVEGLPDKGEGVLVVFRVTEVAVHESYLRSQINQVLVHFERALLGGLLRLNVDFFVVRIDRKPRVVASSKACEGEGLFSIM